MSVKVHHYKRVGSKRIEITELDDFVNPLWIFHPEQIIKIEGELLIDPCECRGWGCKECIEDSVRLRGIQGIYG